MEIIRKLIVIISATLLLAACAKPQPEPRVYCIPLSQWNALTPDQQREAVAWFNDHAFIVYPNLPYSVALGDAQFGPPGSKPRKGYSYYRCTRNMYYGANINVNAYPFKP